MARSVLADEIKKKLPFESASEEAMLNLMRTHSALAGPSETLFKEFGISPPKYNILRILRGSKKTGECGKYGLPSLDIAERMITRVPDITRLVDGLESDGLVARMRCTEDRRVVYVGITQAGINLLEKMDSPVTELNRRLLAHFSKEELAEFNRLLVKARQIPSNEKHPI
jgi:DNA-binding MarR family transcriptional regulator